MKEMPIDFKRLDKQMRAMLDSNMDEENKTGLHNLLGAIYDSKNETVKLVSRRDSEKYIKW